jgi:hypothetical protein
MSGICIALFIVVACVIGFGGLIVMLLRGIRIDGTPFEPEMEPEPEIELPNARLQLDQKGLVGWVVIDGKITTPLAGPVRVKVLSRYLKAVDFTQGVAQETFGHEDEQRYRELRDLAESDHLMAAAGPEYIVELLDHGGGQVRLWLHSKHMKHNLTHLLSVGNTTILGYKVWNVPEKYHNSARRSHYLMAQGWNPLDAD